MGVETMILRNIYGSHGPLWTLFYFFFFVFIKKLSFKKKPNDDDMYVQEYV